MQKSKKRQQKLIGFLAGITLTAIWASWSVITRLGLESELQTFDLYALRLLVASILVAPFIVPFQSWRQLSWKQYFVLGFLGGVPHTLLAYIALGQTTVAHFSIFLYGMTPIATALVGYALLKQRIAHRQLSGALLVISGILALGLEDLLSGFNPTLWLGNGIATLSITLFAGYLVFAERWQITITQSLMACTVLGAVFYLPIWAYFRLDTVLRVPSSELAIQGAFQGIIPGIVSFYIMTLATQRIGANLTSLFFALIPVVSAGLAVVILNEPLTDHILLGLALTTVGIVVCSIDGKALTDKTRPRNIDVMQ